MNAERGRAAAVLGQGGEFHLALEGFVPRQSQQEMTQAVENSFLERDTLLVEAGTGTGKTYAYLVPALLSGLRIAVSTGTRNLQDQLFHRDLPRVREILATGARVALLKGRANYVCLHRLDQALQNQRQKKIHVSLAAIKRWSHTSDSGEIAEHGNHTAAVLAAATSTAENCLGKQCPVFDKCFVVKARQAAKAADVVVINHHLLLSDFQLREEGFGVLPGVDAVVVDEAHQLPELAPQFFGERLSTRQLTDLGHDITTQATILGDVPELVKLATELARKTAAMADPLTRQRGRRLYAEFQALPGVADAQEQLRNVLGQLQSELAPLAARSPELEQLHKRCQRVLAACKTLMDAPEPEGWVRWVEAAQNTKNGGSWQGAPVDTAQAFERLFSAYPGSWVFTSATLSGDDDFTDFRDATGLGNARALRLESPFDFSRQARLYLPPGLPQPGRENYSHCVADSILPLVRASKGGAMILCTSHRAVNRIAEVFDSDTTVSAPVFVQGQGSKATLVERFAKAGNAILIATASFWQGVDIKGRALRVVVIDKLPFQAKGDPIFEARLEAFKKAGRSPFMDYQLPHMIVTLRQGIGRLIRDENDRGLIAICDPRTKTARYGPRVLASLPPMPVVEDEASACSWLEILAAES